MNNFVRFGEKKISIDDVLNIANKLSHTSLSENENFVLKIHKSRKVIEDLLKVEGHVYGVTTGFGDSCTTKYFGESVNLLPKKLINFHRCGLGEFFSESESRAIIASRLASLCNGNSGVRIELLDQMVKLLNHNIIPCIPQEGSVGASGDLTPLSYLGAVLTGQGDVYYKGEIVKAEHAFESEGIKPIELMPKEGLAVMNGTAVMTAIACLAIKRADYLSKLASRMTSLWCIALKGNDFHFDEGLFAVKEHPGQMTIAKRIREDLKSGFAPPNSSRLQDRYSLRCAPHVIGVLEDAIGYFKIIIERELNSTNDNPVVDGESNRVLHGGHFYGGHIAFAMDSLKTLVANIADLMDRQIAMAVDTKFNNGLPPNLTGAEGEYASLNHGFKAVQIGCSAWTAEALKLTMPASVFSRSTECHNQDKVSMGTISARDCLRVLQLTEQVASACLLASIQGINLRIKNNELNEDQLSEEINDFRKKINLNFEFLNEDRPLDKDLLKFIDHIQNKDFCLYQKMEK